MKNNESEKGVTLIETVVYIALFAIVFVTVIQFSLSIAENNQLAQEKIEVTRSVMFVGGHMTETFSNSASIDDTASVFDDDDGVLSLDGSGGASEYTLQNGRIMYTSGGVTVPVSNVDVSVSQFYLEEILDRNDVVVGARVTMEVDSAKGGVTETTTTAYTL